MSAAVIRIEPVADGHFVTVLTDGQHNAGEWFPSWKKARAAAEATQERFTELGVTAEIQEQKAGTAA